MTDTVVNPVVADEEESNLVRHARHELALVGNGPDIDDHVIEMVKIFSAAGHSGYSAFYTVDLLSRLLRFENLTPLTNDPDEWHFHDYSTSGEKNGIWQNRRNGEAFSYDGGNTYYLLSEQPAEGERAFHTSKRSKKMAVKHKAYRSANGAEDVRAIKVTEGNFKNVALWSGGMAISKESKDGDISNQRVRVKGLIAQVGDYVVRHVKGLDEKAKPIYGFYRVKANVFAQEFDAI